jgi:hypothetical protein
MIYFGVQLFHRGFNVAALSSGFIPIAVQHLYFDAWNKLDPWIKSLYSDPDEEAAWFFDESEFNNPSSMAHLFNGYSHCDCIYLVNHRKVVEWARFLFDCKSFGSILHGLKSDKNMDVPLLLASALKLFDKNHIQLLTTQDDLPF